MKDWTKLATEESIRKTIAALKKNGINAVVVEEASEAKAKVFEMLPQGAEVMNMTSVTLDTIGIPDEINKSGKYNSVRNKLTSMDRQTQSLEMQKLGAAPEYTVGSIHAVTEDGKALIASNTGSQTSAYVYGSAHVIWVVGVQKIVKDLGEGIKRIYDYVLPLESKRMSKVYNKPISSFVSKLLIINKEIKEGRLTIILVKENLGF